jgi:hypothetical protein
MFNKYGAILGMMVMFPYNLEGDFTLTKNTKLINLKKYDILERY